MSLDVHLEMPGIVNPLVGTGVFVRDNGSTRELSLEEVRKKWPDAEIQARASIGEVYWRNITHNLSGMADKAGLYEALWRPDEHGITKGKQLIEPLTAGLKKLKDDPELYKSLNPENGWGSYDGLVEFVTEYLQACKDYPDARVSVSR